MSLARLTSLSTQTLSSLLERQRLQSMGQEPPASNLQSITRNLEQLRNGILQLENEDSGPANRESLTLLRGQFARMRGMLGASRSLVEELPEPVREQPAEEPLASSSSLSAPTPPLQRDQPFVPYSDEPPPSPDFEPAAALQHQQLLMDQQDAHLDNLSHSIGRQRDISLQINDELTVHTGLLDELDHDLDRTGDRLIGARRRLDKFSRGVKGNWSSFSILALILVLLILIIVFKT